MPDIDLEATTASGDLLTNTGTTIGPVTRAALAADSAFADVYATTDDLDAAVLASGAAAASQAEMEAGTESGLRQMSPLRVKQAITANAPDQTGVVQLSSFAGATYLLKMQAAMTYAAAQTNVPWIQAPPFEFEINGNLGPSLYNGFKFVGAGPEAPKNVEINANLGLSRLKIGSAVTTGTDSLFHSTATLYDVVVANMVIADVDRTAQFWSQPSGTLYQCEFRNLTFYGTKHAFGNNADYCLVTDVHFTGNWNVQGHANGDLPFHFGGSDCSFWVWGGLNIGGGSAASDGGGQFQLWFENVHKSTVGQGVFVTCDDGWRGVKVTGNARSYPLVFNGCRIEGQSASNPCHGAVMRIEGGNTIIRDVHFAYGMAAPTQEGGSDDGVIEITGGNVNIHNPGYGRANGVAETVPFIHVSGGVVRAYDVMKVDTTIETWGANKPILEDTGTFATCDSTFTET
jgi:hypothetical protein